MVTRSEKERLTAAEGHAPMARDIAGAEIDVIRDVSRHRATTHGNGEVSMQAAALPETLGRYAGRIVDVDSHEMMPALIWTETFGEVARPIAELIMTQAPRIVAAERGDIFICEGAMGKGGGIGLMATPMCSNLMNSAGHRLRPFSTAAEIAPI